MSDSHSRQLAALLEHEARAERNYDEVRAQALLDLAAEGLPEWQVAARVTLTPKVIRARNKLIEARIARQLHEASQGQRDDA